ncbi:MAG TPA: Rho termination factor N-terminal domain-containing protein [Longimicrobium sp.]|nr:Rho termination factor N-terminal domain-containing protein [Longimicrobium sp.]
MPKGWSKHDEDMYEAIKESSLNRGLDEGRAQEIAARTVNKARRQEGRAPNRTTQGTGNPNQGYEARTRDELYNIARQKKVAGRSKMTKDELIAAIRG